MMLDDFKIPLCHKCGDPMEGHGVDFQIEGTRKYKTLALCLSCFQEAIMRNLGMRVEEYERE